MVIVTGTRCILSQRREIHRNCLDFEIAFFILNLRYYMYDKLFRENKLVAFYSLSIVLILLFGVIFASSRRTLNSQAGSNTDIARGCYYKLICPPRQTGSQSIFRCLPTLVCPTPTFFPTPTLARTSLSCNDCTNSNFTNLCFDTVKKAGYCANISPNLSSLPGGLSCVSCSSLTPTPYPTICTPPPACIYSEPRCLLPEPPDGWCELTPTPNLYPL